MKDNRDKFRTKYLILEVPYEKVYGKLKKHKRKEKNDN